MASKAMLDIVANLTGNAEKGIGGLASSVLDLGKTAVLGGVAALTGAVAGLGAAALASWSDFDAGQDSAAKLTGLAGPALDSLGESIKTLKGTSAGLGSSMEDIGTVLGTVEAQTGLTGAALEALTSKNLKLAEITGGDATKSATAFTGIMKSWGLSADDTAQLMDKTLVASQKFGVSVDDMTTALQKNGPGLRAMGFSLDESVGLLSAFQKSGLDSATMLKGLQKATGAMAKSGVDLNEGVTDLFQNIQRAGSETDAMSIAVKAFGVKSAPAFVEAIRSGKLNLDDFTSALAGSSGAIDNTLEGTLDFSDRWQIALGQMQTALIPLGSSLNDLGLSLIPLVQGAFTALMPVATQIIGWFADALPQAIAALQPIFATVISTLSVLIPQAFAAVQTGIQTLIGVWQGLQPVIQPVVDFVTSNLQPILIGLAAAITGILVPAFVAWAFTSKTAVIPAAIATVTALLPILAPIAAIGAAVALLAAAWQNDWGGIQTTVTAWWNTTGQPLFAQIKDWLGTQLTAAIATLSAFWTSTLQPALQQVWGFVQTTVFPILAQFVGWLLNQIPGAIQFLVAAWNTVLAPALQLVWKFLTDSLFPALGTLLGWLKDNIPPAITTLANFWTTTLQPAIAAIWKFLTDNLFPALSTLLGWLKDNIPPAIQGLSDLWNNTLKPALQAIYDFINTNLIPVFKSFVDLGIAVVNLALTALAGLWQNVISPALNALWSFIDTNLTPVFKTLVSDGLDKAHAAMDALAVIWNTVLGPALKTAGDFLGGALKTAIDGIGTALNVVKGLFDALASAINNLKLPDWLTPGSPTPLEYGLLGIRDALAQINGGLLSQFSSGLASIAGGNDPNKAVTSLTQSIAGLGAQLSGSLSSLKDVGQQAVANIAAGLSGGAQQFAGPLQALAGQLVGGLQQALGIHSPSDATANGVGLPLTQGIVQGMQAGWQQVLAGAQQLATSLITLFANQFDPQNVTGVAYAFQQGWEKIATWFRYTWSLKFINILNITMTEIRLAIQGNAAGFSEAGSLLGGALISGMVAAILAGAGQVQGAINNLPGGGGGGGGPTGPTGPTAPVLPKLPPGYSGNDPRAPHAASAGGPQTFGGTVVHIQSLVFNGADGQSAANGFLGQLAALGINVEIG